MHGLKLDTLDDDYFINTNGELTPKPYGTNVVIVGMRECLGFIFSYIEVKD